VTTISLRSVVPKRMADVTYNTSSFPALLRTLAALLALSTEDSSTRGGRVTELDPGLDPDDPGAPRDSDDDSDEKCGPLVVLAYKERDPAERQLWDMMARKTGVVLECVGKQAGAGGLPVEIWLGRMKQGREGRRLSTLACGDVV
jgi:protein N-lysine methyltransferase METTL21D